MLTYIKWKSLISLESDEIIQNLTLIIWKILNEKKLLKWSLKSYKERIYCVKTHFCALINFSASTSCSGTT